MTAAGLVSLYHRAGAFGFPPDSPTHFAGWIGPDDPSIREAARPHITRVGEPYAFNLATMLVRAWQTALPCNAWLMPKSHWHYELHFGNRDLLEPLLLAAGVEPAILQDRNDGSAIVFSPDESDRLRDIVQHLLAGLRGSDFVLVFPDHRTVCTIHHHQQLWWQTTDAQLLSAIRQSTQSSS